MNPFHHRSFLHVYPILVSRGRAGRALTAVVTLVALAGGLGLEYLLKDRTAAHDHAVANGNTAPAAAGAPRTLYTCGMHPEVISDEPGLCPKCDMKLTPMEPDRARMILAARGEAPAELDDGSREIAYWRARLDPGYIRNEPGLDPTGEALVPVYADEIIGGPSIRIDPVTEQNMAVRYDVVTTGPIEREVRTVGRVDYDETSLAAVTTRIDGWVEAVLVRETGTQVHAGDPLFDLYSPELLSAQEELLVALRDAGRGEGRTAELATARLRSARERLRLFDISEEQIARLEQTGEISRTLTIVARATGIVTERNVTAGEFLPAGEVAYRIADLSTVWVIGKVYESDLPFVRLGQEARMTLDYLPGTTYVGRVTYVYPFLEPGTREIPVRMEFHNPGYQLKPGMYATIRVRSRIAEDAVLVPATAVIDTGERQLVFVQRGAGRFEPRRVRVGMRTLGDRFQVLSGLAPGETVVVSGQFLLDSESRLREATMKMLQPGMHAGDAMEAESHVHNAAYETSPGEAGTRFVCPMPAHAAVLYDAAGDCPLCGMRLVPVPAGFDAGAAAIDHWTCPMPEHYDVHLPEGGKCPECGMTLIPVTVAEMERFRHAGQQQAVPPTLYTCPMPSHAHIVADAPGRCPECNMELVPTDAVPHGSAAERTWPESHADHADHAEHADHADHATTPAASGAAHPQLYVCPMETHKHIVSDEPGRCPDCNMELVPTEQMPFGEESVAIWLEQQAH